MTDFTLQWQDQIRASAAAGRSLEIRGGGSKAFFGGQRSGALLDARPHLGIVCFEPTELVVTVRCGTPLTELQQTLAEAGQMLAFEPPHFGEATVGGMVAAGLSGPRRAQAGAVRDHLLGVTLLDGRGDLLRFGGQVMKNVAGYDVSRLMAGAWGTLGLLLEVSLRVVPRPAAEETLCFELGQAAALETLQRWGGQPLPVSATCWCGDRLHLRLAGAAAAVRAAVQSLGGERLAAASADAFWLGVREHQHPFFDPAAALWRLSLPATTPATTGAEDTLIEWGGALRWLRAGQGDEAVLEQVRASGGSVQLFRAGSQARALPLAQLPPALQKVHAGLKRSFDPAGVFNRGLLAADW